MTGPEHYREAERLLEEFTAEVEVRVEALPTYMAALQTGMAQAQAHATLALAAATALRGSEQHGLPIRDWDEWHLAAGVKRAKDAEPQS